jgi:hypothetical protein
MILETIFNTKPAYITIRYSIPASAQWKHCCICWGVRPAPLDAALLRAVAAGKVTPEEAEPVSTMLTACLKMVETVDIDRRVRDLESKMIVPK